MGETLEEFYERLRKEVAQSELEYLKSTGADDERIRTAAERIEEG